MPAINRIVGSVSQILPVFIPDATVSTGAGLANIVATNVTLSWFRDNMSAVSTQTLSSGTLGTWASSTFTQASSTLALGWYDVSLPNGVFQSGSTAAVHIYGAASMAPVPIIIELSASAALGSVNVSSWAGNPLTTGGHTQLGVVNQGTVSTATASTIGLPINYTNDILAGASLYIASGTGAGQTRNIDSWTQSTSTATISPNFTTTPISTSGFVVFANLPASTSNPAPVNVIQVQGTAAVTQSAGIFATAWDLGRTANLTSTIALTGTSIAYVTTAGNAAAAASVNVTSIAGSPVVTTAAGVIATTWDLSRTANLTSTIALTGTSVNYVTTAGNAAAAANVNVTAVAGSPVVTTAAGVVATAWDLGRTANLTSTVALTGFSINYVTTAGSASANVNVTSVAGSPIVTTAAGVVATAWDLGRTANLTSTIALTGTSISYVTTAGSVTGLTPSLLDASVSSRLASSSYTTPPTVAQITTGVLATNVAEAYRTNASTGTVAQILYEILAHHGEAAINITTKTINKVDHATAAATFTLDSSTSPTSITRAS